MNRIPLPVVREGAELVECTDCAKCCTYVGVGIATPNRARYATDLLWSLSHEHVYVYVDGNKEWSVHFETRCRNLGDDLLCGIYETRPHLCRNFDNKTCEVNDIDHESLTFRDPGAFLAFSEVFGDRNTIICFAFMSNLNKSPIQTREFHCLLKKIL